MKTSPHISVHTNIGSDGLPYMPGYKERCEKSKSDVVVFCPKKDWPSSAKYGNITVNLNKKLEKQFTIEAKTKKKKGTGKRTGKKHRTARKKKHKKKAKQRI